MANVAKDYTTLEAALEQAAARLPIKIFCSFLERAERIITTDSCGESLEAEILELVVRNNPSRKSFNFDHMAADLSAAA